ncbi:MAG: alpha-amylase family glycosyl hydrolase [Faecalimonas sp.]|nr:alpha-amylase family glycosyl hydrolase [Faecalimonas sp.]
MREKRGYPLPLGISEKEGYINFSIVVEQDKECILRLYKKGAETPTAELLLSQEDAEGEVRYIALAKADVKAMEYQYVVDGVPVVDPYAKSVVECEGVPVRARVMAEEYDWEGDRPLGIPYHEVIAYNLHVRGFTKHRSSKVKKKGTFQGVIEKIPYLQELGINQIQCMPVYSFEEHTQYHNYWGYGDAYCFAVKNAYAAGKSPERELKDMVKACHKAGIEVVLHLPYAESTSKQIILDSLRYYRMEYHIDGFVLNPHIAPMEVILSDPILKTTKILQNRDEFQFAMRRFLKGEDDALNGLIWWLRQRTKDSGSCNYITNHTGFTLADLVSYNEKHNEANGEGNQDGPDYNCSWNCGVEGNTRKKAVLELRKRQMRNAMFLLMTAQGTPSILAGDEFGNSQKGNNNVYCQDNEISWLDWKGLEKNSEFFEYVKSLIALRKHYPILHKEEALLGADRIGCGVPDVSYHGESAWQAPTASQSRQLGVYYHSDADAVKDCFIAYNMHEGMKPFALPSLPKGKKWYPVFTTADEKTLAEQKLVCVEGRTIVMFEGR